MLQLRYLDPGAFWTVPVAMLMLGFAGLGRAEEAPSSWTARITPLWMETNGWDSSIGQVVDVKFGVLAAPYSVEYNLGGAPAIRAAIGRTWKDWQLEFTGWYFRPTDELQGTVQPTQQILFWQQPQSFAQSKNDKNEYSASESLSAFAVDFLAFRGRANTPDRSVELGGGLKLSGLDTRQTQAVTAGFNQRQFPDFYNTKAVLDQSSGAETRYLGVGPVVTLQAEGQKGPARFRALLGQAVLVGQSRSQGAFTAVDQKSFEANALTPPGLMLPPPQSRVSAISYETNQIDIVPVTELELVASYQLARGVSLGLSGFLSVWWNAPVAPTFQVANTANSLGLDCQRTNSCQPLAGTWSKQRDTLVFPGIGIELGINF